MNNKNHFRLTHVVDGTRITVKIPGDSNLETLTEYFEQFVRACGFYVDRELAWVGKDEEAA